MRNPVYDPTQWLAAIVDSSDDAIISKNLDGIITSWNRGAQRLFGWTAEEAIGRPILLIVPPDLHDEEAEILNRLRAGEVIERHETVRVTKAGSRVDVSLTISPVRDFSGRIVGASKIAHDIAERRLAAASLIRAHEELESRVLERTAQLQEKNEELIRQTELVHELSARLMRLQDEERRHIARELHDSVGQVLAGLSMNVAKALRQCRETAPEAAAALADCTELLDQGSREIRTLSHLLHPPLLDEIGLSSALRSYVEEFAKRSGIAVRLDLPDNLGRLTDELEISIFRIVQECLTNVHRHSGSAEAEVYLVSENEEIRLQVRDKGKGISMKEQRQFNVSGRVGVGLRGMRERVRQLDGTLTVESNGNGTVVTATLPANVLACSSGERSA